MMGWEEFKVAVVGCTGIGAIGGALVGVLYWLACWWLARMWR